MLIYIVEDEERIRNLESYALEKNGFEVMSFADSGGFYQAMDDRAPDLILLDIMLPGDDGNILRVSIRSDSIFRLFERSLLIILIVTVCIIIVSMLVSVKLTDWLLATPPQYGTSILQDCVPVNAALNSACTFLICLSTVNGCQIIAPISQYLLFRSEKRI